MKNGFQHDWSIEKTNDFDSLPRWFDAFLLDRRAQRMSTGTIEFYVWKLKLIDQFLREQGIKRLAEITPSIIRSLLIDLETTYRPDRFGFWFYSKLQCTDGYVVMEEL